MDFMPLGSTTFTGTDQISSDVYIDSGTSYNMLMNDAQIHQQKQPIYRSELALLEKARASKLDAQIRQQNASTPTPAPAAVEPFHNYQQGVPMQKNNIADLCNVDEMSMFMILLVVLIVISCYMYRRVIHTCNELDALVAIIGQPSTNVQSQSPQQVQLQPSVMGIAQAAAAQ
jgi:hypothetical protein